MHVKSSRKNRRVASLKHRAVIDIPFPHETADKHKWLAHW